MINDGILITTNKWPSALLPRGKKGVEVQASENGNWD